MSPEILYTCTFAEGRFLIFYQEITKKSKMGIENSMYKCSTNFNRISIRKN